MKSLRVFLVLGKSQETYKNDEVEIQFGAYGYPRIQDIQKRMNVWLMRIKQANGKETDYSLYCLSKLEYNQYLVQPNMIPFGCWIGYYEYYEKEREVRHTGRISIIPNRSSLYLTLKINLYPGMTRKNSSFVDKQLGFFHLRPCWNKQYVDAYKALGEARRKKC